MSIDYPSHVLFLNFPPSCRLSTDSSSQSIKDLTLIPYLSSDNSRHFVASVDFIPRRSFLGYSSGVCADDLVADSPIPPVGFGAASRVDSIMADPENTESSDGGGSGSSTIRQKKKRKARQLDSLAEMSPESSPSAGRAKSSASLLSNPPLSLSSEGREDGAGGNKGHNKKLQAQLQKSSGDVEKVSKIPKDEEEESDSASILLERKVAVEESPSSMRKVSVETERTEGAEGNDAIEDIKQETEDAGDRKLKRSGSRKGGSSIGKAGSRRLKAHGSRRKLAAMEPLRRVRSTVNIL